MRLPLARWLFFLLLILFAVPQITIYAASDPQSLPIFSRIYDPKRDPIRDGNEALKIALGDN